MSQKYSKQPKSRKVFNLSKFQVTSKFSFQPKVAFTIQTITLLPLLLSSQQHTTMLYDMTISSSKGTNQERTYFRISVYLLSDVEFITVLCASLFDSHAYRIG